MDIEQQAEVDARDKVIAKIYYGKEGGLPEYIRSLITKMMNLNLHLKEKHLIILVR